MIELFCDSIVLSVTGHTPRSRARSFLFLFEHVGTVNIVNHDTKRRGNLLKNTIKSASDKI